MALILAIQPNAQQAAILSGVVMNQLRADLVLVDSKEAALARIRKHVPDLILLAAELGRPDDEEFASRLRRIENAGHLRTLSMPRLGNAEEGEDRPGGGLLGAFKRKRVDNRPRGRDPKLFAKELRSYLKRAERLKADRLFEADTMPPNEPTPVPDVEPEPAAPVEPDLAFRVEPTPEPPVEAAPGSTAGPVAAPAAAAAAPPPGAPTATLPEIETRVAMSMRALDTGDAGPTGDVDVIIRALRVPPRVAGFEYPRGCRISHIRLGAPIRQRTTRRPVMEPPPTGSPTRSYAAS